MQHISSLIGDELEKVEVELFNVLSSDVPIINKAGGYIIGSGGKRFRPLMLLLAAKYCNYRGEKHINLACIFEFIHTATLLHDDVLDHAKMRRGNSSVNSVWGNQTSVLVGDFLLSKAFSMLVEIGDIKIMKVVSNATTQVAEGEVMQTDKSSDTNLTEEEYITIITKKTASLISAACQTGAILGGSSTKMENNFRNYGLHLGIAFQMVDDALDYVSDDQRFGKSMYKDLQEKKITLPLIHTLKKASAKDREKILKMLKSDSLDEKKSSVVAQLIEDYQGVTYVYSKARESLSACVGYLKEMDSSPVRDALMATANYAVERKW